MKGYITLLKMMAAALIVITIMMNIVPAFAQGYSLKKSILEQTLIRDEDSEISKSMEAAKDNDQEEVTELDESEEMDGSKEDLGAEASEEETGAKSGEEAETEEEAEEEAETEEETETEIQTEVEQKDLLDLIPDDENLMYPESGVAVVFTAAGLKTALQNEEIHQVHLGTDIRLQEPIRVLNSDGRLGKIVIDGTNPYDEDFDEEQPIFHKLTERTNDPGFSMDNIYLNSSGNLTEITLANLIIQGYNYYGTFQFATDDDTKGKTLIYDNVTYYGSQPIYISYGRAIIKDSEIYLTKDAPRLGEVAEAAAIELMGEVHIERQRNDGNSLFFLRAAPGDFIVREDARVTITDDSTTINGLYYMAANNYRINIEMNSYFSYRGNHRISGNALKLSEFTIGEGAEVLFEMSGSLTGGLQDGPIFTSVFTVEEDSKVVVTALKNKNTAEIPLINTNSLYVNNPRYMVVLNQMPHSTMNAINTLYTEITTDEIRHWNVSLSDIEGLLEGSAKDVSSPLRWYNGDGSAFQVKASYTAKDFSGYQGGDDTTSLDQFRFINTNGIAYSQLNRIMYDKGEAVAGEVPVDEGSPYRSDTEVTVLGNTGGLIGEQGHFTGWKTYNSDVLYRPGQSILVDSDIELTAVFDMAKLLVSFEVMAAGVENPAGKEIVFGSPYGSLPEIEREGYRFIGWYDAALDGSRITAETIVTTNINHTLYARWQPLYQIAIYYVDKQGMKISSASEQLSVLAGDTVDIIPAVIDGYEARHYQLTGSEEFFPLSESLQPDKSLEVFIYYASTMITISFPDKVDFYAYLSDKGTVKSEDYQVVNRSDLPVRVSFKKLSPRENEMDGITLVAAASGRDELHLNLVAAGGDGDNGFTRGISNIYPDYEYDFLLGTLTGSFPGNQSGTSATGSFQISGFYAGRFYGNFRRPKVNFTFHYELDN